jgi:HK97 family phage major capsid protein
MRTALSQIELKDENGDPAAVVTKALGEFQTAVDSRLKAVETKSTDAAKLTERLDKIEAKINRPAVHTGAVDGDEKKQAEVEKKTYAKFIRNGRENLAAEEQKSLFEGNDVQGGYLNFPQFSTEVIRYLTLFSPVRQVARINQTANSSLILPVRGSITNALWEGEISTATESDPAWLQEQIPVHELRTYCDISQRLLEDSAVDVVAEVNLAMGEDFGKKENASFVSGSGTDQPEGFMVNADVGYVASGDANLLTADGLINLFFGLPAAYRNAGTWVMNGQTIGAVRALVTSGTGRPLWVDSLSPSNPATLLGRPVVEFPDMPAIAANSYPIAFGDWQNAYRIVDRIGLTVLRDPFSQAANGIVRFHARRRVGGYTVKAEALKKLKIAVS